MDAGDVDLLRAEDAVADLGARMIRKSGYRFSDKIMRKKQPILT
ncbi:hypothetical protein ACVWXO_009054 [Bradyrhizobium sp. LM2.7]